MRSPNHPPFWHTRSAGDHPDQKRDAVCPRPGGNPLCGNACTPVWKNTVIVGSNPPALWRSHRAGHERSARPRGSTPPLASSSVRAAAVRMAGRLSNRSSSSGRSVLQAGGSAAAEARAGRSRDRFAPGSPSGSRFARSTREAQHIVPRDTPRREQCSDCVTRWLAESDSHPGCARNVRRAMRRDRAQDADATSAGFRRR